MGGGRPISQASSTYTVPASLPSLNCTTPTRKWECASGHRRASSRPQEPHLVRAPHTPRSSSCGQSRGQQRHAHMHEYAKNTAAYVCSSTCGHVYKHRLYSTQPPALPCGEPSTPILPNMKKERAKTRVARFIYFDHGSVRSSAAARERHAHTQHEKGKQHSEAFHACFTSVTHVRGTERERERKVCACLSSELPDYPFPRRFFGASLAVPTDTVSHTLKWTSAGAMSSIAWYTSAATSGLSCTSTTVIVVSAG